MFVLYWLSMILGLIKSSYIGYNYRQTFYQPGHKYLDTFVNNIYIYVYKEQTEKKKGLETMNEETKKGFKQIQDATDNLFGIIESNISNI